MQGTKLGYVRVSSKDQNEARQIASMQQIGIDERHIFIDKQSGKDFDREEYKSLKRYMREGDILYIHSLDRFGRNKDEIVKEWHDITKERKVDIVVLDMPLLDTTKYRDSMGTFISDLVLQILSWVAQEEKDRINKRQREGIDIALAEGRPYGRPKKEITPEFIEMYDKWQAGEITAVAAFKSLDISKATFYKRVKEYEAAQ